MRAFRSAGARTHWALCALAVIAAILLIVACASEGGGNDSATAASDVVRINHNLSSDLTGDGTPESISIAAQGRKVDSLDVRLEIRSGADSLLYAASWNTRFYFQYDDRSAISDSAADAKVRAQLERLVADSAIRVNTLDLTAPAAELAMLRDAIRFDIATEESRRAHGIPAGDPLPPTARDSVNTLAAKVAPARIDALVTELKGRKAFWFHAGGEVTYAIAWSDREKRFVTIFSCC